MAGNGSRYTKELRDKALKLSDEIGNKKAAAELGINVKTLDYWRCTRRREEEKKLKEKLSKVIPTNEINPTEELKDNPKISFQPVKEDIKNYERGEIYYVTQKPTTGSEIATGRPAVIVSNQSINKNLNTIEVVFLTTKVKSLAPEHIIIKSSGAIATTICEQISTIDKSRLREYIGMCTPDEMKLIEKAMLYSLGLEKYATNLMKDDQIISRITGIKAERDAYKDMYAKLFERYIQEVKCK